MTRHYKPLYTKRRKIAVIAVPIALVLLVLCTPLLSFLLGPGHILARPFWWLSQSISGTTHSAGQTLASKKSLVREVNDLRAEVARLQAVDAENRFLHDENTELQRLFDVTPVTKPALLARVLVRPPQTWYDSLVIDKGTNDFIQVGDDAYAYGTVPLGKVVSVTAHTAIVELYSASARTTDAILIPGNIPVSLEGRGNSAFHFEVHRDAAVDNQSTLVLPTGELLATVKNIQFDPRDPFRSVNAVAAVNLQHLRFITISVAAK